MKYKVRKGPEYFASRQTFSLEEIEQRLRSGVIDSTYQVRADGQANWQSVEDISSVTMDLAMIRSEPRSQASSEQEQSAEAFLKAVRRRTCYPVLRDMIDWFAVLSIIAIVILAGLYVVAGLKAKIALSVIIGVVVGVLGCFLVIASKQASLLLVDIADTLIEQNRTKSGDRE